MPLTEHTISVQVCYSAKYMPAVTFHRNILPQDIVCIDIGSHSRLNATDVSLLQLPKPAPEQV